jgi:hypothetical protein
MHILNSMRIIAKRDDVLATLRTNRDTHKKIVDEAKAGYIEKAKEVLMKRFDQLKAGKITNLVFQLRVPVDQTKVYDTAIRMLELHQNETLELDAGQVRNLMQDEWDWTDSFYSTNSAYSGTAASNVRENDDQ